MASRTTVPPGLTTVPDTLHHVLHRQAAGRGAGPVVTVEPARDGVTAEVDDLAAETIERADQGVEDPVEVGGQLFGAALWAELGGEDFGDGREAGDVGEHGGTVDAVGELATFVQRPAAISRHVGLGVVAGRGLSGRRQTPAR